jgi:hypothetical protein
MQTEKFDIDLDELLAHIRSEAQRRRMELAEKHTLESSSVEDLKTAVQNGTDSSSGIPDRGRLNNTFLSGLKSWFRQRSLSNQVFASCMGELSEAMRKLVSGIEALDSKTDHFVSRVAQIEQCLIRERGIPIGQKDIAKKRSFSHSEDLRTFYQSLIERRCSFESSNAEWIREYLDLIKGWNPTIERAPMMDIDCGSGVWLESLLKMGCNVSGVEQDDALFAHCQSRGLPVTHMNAATRLQSIETNSFGFISAFQLADRYSLSEAFYTATEIYRVLKSGSLAIFRVPNAIPESWLNNKIAPAVVDRRMDPLQILSDLLLHIGFTIHRVYTHTDRSAGELHTPLGWRAIAAQKPIGPDNFFKLPAGNF